MTSQFDPTLPPRRRLRARKFGRPDHVLAELGKVVAGLWAGYTPGEPLDTRKANALVCALSSVAAVLRDEKLAAIEAQLAELKRAGVLK